jgi:OHCU decarboxylase
VQWPIVREPVTLAQLNTFDRSAFVAALGWIFEASPWVAERAWTARPFATIDALHRAMHQAVAAASSDEQLALLRAHPDLGARLAMSDASSREQSGAGLVSLDAASRTRLRELNDRYRQRFGFPFLFAVKGSTPADILAALDRRLERTPAEEFAEALQQVSLIARFRLDDAIDRGSV